VEAAKHAGFLRQVADAEPRPPMHRQGGDVGAVEADRAGVGPHQADDHVEGRGLAGAVRPEQPDRLAASQPDRDVPHHGPLLVGLADATGDQPAATLEQPQFRRLARGAHGLASLAGGGFFCPAAPPVAFWASFGTTRPWTLPAVPEIRRETPVFKFTSASAPFSWFWPRVMRTLPPSRAMPVSGM